MVIISGAYGKLKRWVKAQIAAIVLSSLADVDDTNIANDKVLVYKSASGKHEYETQTGGGVTDHGALTGLADDDHLQYTKDTEVDAIVLTHKNIVNAHHAKYLDSEAVAAVLADDKYVKNTGDTIAANGNLSLLNGLLSIRKNVALNTSIVEILCNATSSQGYIKFENKTSAGGLFIPGIVFQTYGYDCFAGIFVGRVTTARDTYDSTRAALIFQGEKSGTQLVNSNVFMLRNYSTPLFTIEADGSMNLEDHKIKDPKNHAASALSGTKKLVEIDIGGSPYYFEVYPTKA